MQQTGHSREAADSGVCSEREKSWIKVTLSEHQRGECPGVEVLMGLYHSAVTALIHK